MKNIENFPGGNKPTLQGGEGRRVGKEGDNNGGLGVGLRGWRRRGGREGNGMEGKKEN